MKKYANTTTRIITNCLNKKLKIKGVQKLIVKILMIIALIGIIKDFTTLMMGATYTWFGALTGFINVIIVGKGWDYLERV